jgi:hypothetical protein
MVIRGHNQWMGIIGRGSDQGQRAFVWNVEGGYKKVAGCGLLVAGCWLLVLGVGYRVDRSAVLCAFSASFAF